MFRYKIISFVCLCFLIFYLPCYSLPIPNEIVLHTQINELIVDGRPYELTLSPTCTARIIRNNTLYFNANLLEPYLPTLPENLLTTFGDMPYISLWNLASAFNLKLLAQEGTFYLYNPNYIATPAQSLSNYASSFNNLLGVTSNQMPSSIPILMYHLCMDKVPSGLKGMAVTPARFEEQLLALQDSGYTTISFDEYYDAVTYGTPLPFKPILITFDDGYENNYTHAFPILKRHNMKATLFVNPATVDHDTGTYSHLSWKQLREMEASGLVDVQSHGYEHTSIKQLSPTSLENSVYKGFSRIETELGLRKIHIFSYPTYSYSKNTVSALKQMDVHMQVTTLGEQILFSKNFHHLTRQRVSQGTSGPALIQLLQ